MTVEAQAGFQHSLLTNSIIIQFKKAGAKFSLNYTSVTPVGMTVCKGISFGGRRMAVTGANCGIFITEYFREITLLDY